MERGYENFVGLHRVEGSEVVSGSFTIGNLEARHSTYSISMRRTSKTISLQHN